MYHLIVNGKNLNKKLANKLEEIKAIFEKAGKEYALHITDHERHATEIAAELTRGGKFAHLVAVGGDGTLHEVLNGIADTEKCCLGIIPLGTGNDFAKAAGIPKDVKFAAETIVFRAPTHIDYIQLSSGLRSINAVGAGMDVDVLERTLSGKSKGKNKYFKAFLKSLMHYKATEFTVEYDGVTETHTGLIACLGNGKQIGGGIKLFPDAELSDGYLDLTIVDYLSRPRTASAFIKLMGGRIGKVREAKLVRCKQVKMTFSESTKIQAEGEIYENVPLEAHIVSGKLKFYLPNND